MSENRFSSVAAENIHGTEKKSTKEENAYENDNENICNCRLLKCLPSMLVVKRYMYTRLYNRYFNTLFFYYTFRDT